MSSWLRATGDRFLDGFEENVISGQRSIRIFGKLFMESEMTSILVQGSDQNRLEIAPKYRKYYTNSSLNVFITVLFL